MMTVFTAVSYTHLHTEGITKITPTDIKYAQAMGRAIKLLATSKKGPKGYTAIVAPFLLPASHPLYAVDVYKRQICWFPLCRQLIPGMFR